ncbi:m148.5 protein [Murid betaherpesvirus 1]|nr:m148.5 protein [Murid betaherpesvirus 1]
MRLDGGYRTALWGWLVICRILGPGLCQNELRKALPPLSVVYLAWTREDGSGPAFEASISLYYTFPFVYVTDDGVWDGVEGGGTFNEESSEVIFLRAQKRYLSDIRSRLFCNEEYDGKLGVRYDCDRARGKTTCEIAFLKNETVILLGRYLEHFDDDNGTLRIEYTDPEAVLLQKMIYLGPDKKNFARAFEYFFDYWAGVHNRFLDRVRSNQHHMNVMYTTSVKESSVTCSVYTNMPVRFYMKMSYVGIEPVTAEADIPFFNGSVSAHITLVLDFPESVTQIPVSCDVYSKTMSGQLLTHVSMVKNPKLATNAKEGIDTKLATNAKDGIDIIFILTKIIFVVCVCLLIYMLIFIYRLICGIRCNEDRDRKQKVL